MDYFVWGAIERVTNKTACPNKEELKARIRSAFADLDSGVVEKACARFRSRLEAVIQAGGDFIE